MQEKQRTAVGASLNVSGLVEHKDRQAENHLETDGRIQPGGGCHRVFCVHTDISNLVITDGEARRCVCVFLLVCLEMDVKSKNISG